MKKIITFILLALLCAAILLPIAAIAEGEALVESAGDIVAPTTPEAGEPFTWGYLATIAGAAAFTLLVVQFFKVPLDRVWKVPTRVVAYVIALAAMLVATAFTSGLTLQTALLAAVNAIIAALTAMGAYEVTFRKLDA